MKIALCFYGLVGSKIGKNGEGEVLDPKIAYEYYKKHIFDVNDEVDVFIHSWSYDMKDRLVELYEPKKYIIETQKCFPESALHPKLWPTVKSKIKLLGLKLFKPEHYKKISIEKYKEVFRAYSRWYSSKKSLELKKEYEKEQGFKYDVVMITRLDVGFFTDLVFSEYDMKYFYASHWNHMPYLGQDEEKNKNELNYVGKGFYDQWFFSNSENMDKFATLFDNIEKYHINPHRASFEHAKQIFGEKYIRYTLYRWYDHEMIRVKIFGNLTPDDKKRLEQLEGRK